MTVTALLKIKEVSKQVGLSKATIYRLMKAGEFPRPINLSQARVAWRQADLDNWLDSLSTSEGF